MNSEADETDFSQSPRQEDLESAEQAPKPLRIPHPVTLLLFGILFALIGVALMIWLPVLQTRRTVEELERRGAVVQTQLGQHEWIQQWIELPDSEYFAHVAAVDASHAEMTDADLELLAGMRHLQSLALYGPQLTDDGINHLLELPALRSLLLLHCPGVTPAAEARLQATYPRLTIVRRGSAFLGVAGTATPQGCRVNVVPKAAAALAGMRSGDVIVEFNDEPVPDFDALVKLIANHEPEDVVVIEALRRDKRLQFETVLGRWR